MNKYQKYYSEVEKYQKKFELLLDKLKTAKTEDEKFLLAQTALTFAVSKNTGYFTSSVLENFYTNYAKSIDTDDYDIDYEPNSFLHVLTSGYKTGGHTRVVERWIKNAPDIEKHSVVFLNQREDIETIESNVKEKNGECIYFEQNLSLKDSALKLRKLGLNFEYIVLHTHMDDPIATVAFGCEKFTRPVIFYNHASHLFWIGKSIADITVDILEYDEITYKNRDISNVFNLGIPVDLKKIDKKNKIECRKKVNIPIDKKIIISAGEKRKYCSIGEDNFIETMKKIIDNDTYCYVIGPSMKDKEWKKAFKETKGHIIPLGYINYNDGYLEYVAAADLYVDSAPFCGWTAVIDAVTARIPALCYANTQLDYINKTSGCAINKEEFIEKAKKILKDKEFAKMLIDEEFDSLYSVQSKEAWNQKMKNLIEKVPKVHQVKTLTKDDFKEIIDVCVLDNAMSNKAFLKKNCLKKFWYWLNYLKYTLLQDRKRQINYFIKFLG